MIDKINTQVNISVTLKAKLETKAAQLEMGYRDYLTYLIDNAVESDNASIDDGPTKQTRLALSESTKERVKHFAKRANCTQEQWLLNVFLKALEA